MSAPIVLVHGIFGFDRLRVLGFDVADYFRDIPKLLREAGYTVPAPPALRMGGSIAQRANDLKTYLNTSPDVAAKKVHLIAHSMGGLDSRYMISRLGMADRVISLTTISTPHHGSPIADLVASAAPGVDQILSHVGINLTGVADLTTAACAAFNAATPDADSVKYFSVAGWFTPLRIGPTVWGMLGATHDIIYDREGENDGMVSLQSARFGEREDRWEFFGQINANHFREVNWGQELLPTPAEDADFSIKQMYLNIANFTAACGIC